MNRKWPTTGRRRLRVTPCCCSYPKCAARLSRRASYKGILFALAAFALLGCRTHVLLKPVGSRSPEGLPVGDFRFLNPYGATQAQGPFKDGKMDGTWVFWDSEGAKTAELTYERGVRSGPFRLYYGSFFDPAAAGKLKVTGSFKNGRQVGEHIAYLRSGSVDSRATIHDNGEIEASVGSPELAKRLIAADDRLFPKLESAVFEAIK